MIRLIEALNYRCLRYVRQPLGPFHVLVGPNASGKTTFLDILGFLSNLVTDGLEAATQERSASVFDLLWDHQGPRFEFAIEAVVPEKCNSPIHPSPDGGECGIRYEIAIGLDDRTSKVSILNEQVWLTSAYECEPLPNTDAAPETLFGARIQDPRWRSLMTRPPGGAEYHLVPQTPGEGFKNHWIVHRLSGNKPVFGAMSERQFPTPVWLENFLKRQVSTVDLETSALKRPARPGQGEAFMPDGENLPWLIDALQTQQPEQYNEWIAHLRTGLPDLHGLRVVDRPEDRHRYIMVGYQRGLEVPSWMVSDGTLRLIALTFLAYRADEGTVYLVEEPETHIHPLNIEVAMQSLSSVYGGQVLIATHSPAILAMTDPSKVLVFSRDDVFGTRIVPGNEHPRLRDWKGEVSLGTLFASGVLG